MPRFEPFAAVRFAAAENLSRVIAPPYDVLSDADVEALAARSPHNIVHVDVPRGGADRYERAAGLMQNWLADGVLEQDGEPGFTIYRMRFTDASGAAWDIAGVLGGLEVVDADAGGVLPHERTTPKASTDRLDLTRATRANLSPVWGLSLAAGLTALLTEPGEPVGRLVEDGVEHLVERVTDPVRVAAIQSVVAADDVLIADGHHRYGISRTYRDEVRSATGRTDTAAEQTLAFVNELVPEQLSVAAIHRLYSDVTLAELTAAIEPHFEVTSMDPPTAGTLAAMEADGFLVLVGRGAAWRLSPKDGAFPGVRALDGAWLEAALADAEPSVAYQHGLDETLAAVDSGEAAAAVLIRPVSVAEIERTAREGLLMPPKSTFFTPKLKTGFVIRLLGGGSLMPAVQLTIDCHDARVLVPFWCLALDYVPNPPPTGHATWNDWYLSVGVPEDELDLSSDGTDRILDPTGRGAKIWFQPVPEAKSVKNRLHLDIFVGQDENGVKYPYAERATRVRAKADALIAAGATEIGHVTAPEHDRFTVQLADPEGNELCLL